MKCDVCRKLIGTTFLKKPVGTFVKDSKGKPHPVCFECQKKLNTKEAILKAVASVA
ncbi:hypothetical protein HYY74_00260 [Candidatus Woesearchaeota archaeon]|nr:hypothetical protein [Candidatus Woesearchaeota archaeon]